MTDPSVPSDAQPFFESRTPEGPQTHHKDRPEGNLGKSSPTGCENTKKCAKKMQSALVKFNPAMPRRRMRGRNVCQVVPAQRCAW